MIEIKIEKQQCFCVKCEVFQEEELVYEKVTCNNVLHALLSLVTVIWVMVWFYKRKESVHETGHNRRLALLASKCKKCGGPLILSDPADQDLSKLMLNQFPPEN